MSGKKYNNLFSESALVLFCLTLCFSIFFALLSANNEHEDWLNIAKVNINDSLVPTGESVVSLAEGSLKTPPVNEVDYNICGLIDVWCEGEKKFIVSAYNTVTWQTDGNPCTSASGDNICGRNDTIACSRKYKLGTKFLIEGKTYTCLDRLADKYDERIDINFDKDIKGAKAWGIKRLNILVMK